MARRLPPLNALRVFEAAARHRSFARAAQELHVTPAAISQQIKLLEDYLDVPLFKRGKTLALSEPATTVLPLVSEAFDQMERAMMKVRADRGAGPLVVSVPPAFAARWLVPRLEDFHAKHPEVELHLLATPRLVDFAVEDVDLAIRFGSGNYPGLRAERLMPETMLVVAASEVAKTIKSPADIARANLIEDDMQTSRGGHPDWETWLKSLGVAKHGPLRIRHFDDSNLAIEAAVSGLGVALAWHSLVEADLKAGRLVRLLDRRIPTTLGYHLVIPENRATLAKVVAFREWLFDLVANEQKT